MLTNLNLPLAQAAFGVTAAAGFTVSPRGAILFVNSAVGVDSSSRLRFFGTTGSATSAGPQGDVETPLASVFGTNGALSYCTAGRGDLVVVLPGHSENLSTDGAYSVPANVTILGIGTPTTRPSFALTGGTTTTITLGASALMQNVHINASGVASLVTAFTLSGAGAVLDGLRVLIAATGQQALSAILVSASDVTLTGIDVDALAASGAVSGAVSGAAVARLKILNCSIKGNFSTGPIVSASTNHITDMLIDNCFIQQLNGTAKAVLVLTTSSTGCIRNCSFKGSTWSTAADAITGGSSTSMLYSQNFGFDNVGSVGAVLIPAAGTIA